MIFTTILSSHHELKFPSSTTDDPKVFEFVNQEVFGMKPIANLFAKNYVLNYPLKQSTIRKRSRASIEPLLAQGSEFMIVDFNDVRDEDARREILQLFAPFKHVAFKTRACDDIFSFNFRIVLAIPSSTRTKLRQDTIKLSKRINPTLARVNTTVYFKAQVTACGNNGIVSVNEDGLLFNMQEFGEAQYWEFTDEIQPVVLGLFEELGFKIKHESVGSATLTHPDLTPEFMWFSSNPFIIVNQIDDDKIDVSQEFKKRHKIEKFRKSTPVKQLMSSPTIKRRINHVGISVPTLSGASITKEINDCIANEKCLVIKSAMGTGKTHIIREMISKSDKTLIITPRVSLAEELYQRLKDDNAKIYNQHRPEDSRVFITQFDSLFKIDTKTNQFSTIIIDEFMTLADHMTSSVAKNLEHNISKYISLLNKSKCLMLSDAFMEEISLDLIPTKFKQVNWINNSNKDAASVIIHKDISSFLCSMLAKRTGGLVVSCVSVQAGLQIKHFLETAGISCGLINADTPLQVREKILHDYKTKALNSVVFSPSISVGVNLLGLRGSQYHYDPGNVIPVIQSIQMTKRARNSGQIECFIKKNTKSFVPSLEEERYEMLSSGNVVYNEDGDRVLSAVGRLQAILQYHKKIWAMDPVKSFARLAHQNFAGVSMSLNNNYKKANLSLKSTGKIAEVMKYQPLEIFGSKTQFVIDRISPDNVEDFLLFEKFYRVSSKLEGWEICFQDLTKKAIFGLTKQIELFTKCKQGTKIKIQEEHFKLPDNWIHKRGLFWGTEYHLNPVYLEICEYLHST